MKRRRNVMLAGIIVLMVLSVPSVFVGSACGAGLYTRMDTLSCGNVDVRALTTCPEDSKDPSACTDQHFLFVNKKTGTTIRMDRSGKSVVRGDSRGKVAWIRDRGLAYAWACEESKAGFYIFVEAASGRSINWDELWDLRGKKLANNRNDSDETWDRFYKVWNSKHLPVHPLPDYDLVPIQLFKTNRVDYYNPWP